LAEEIQVNTQTNDETGDFSLDQSRLATVLIGVLVILAGYLVYDYLAVDNQTTLPTSQPTTQESADNQEDQEQALGEITDEGDFQTEETEDQTQDQPQEEVGPDQPTDTRSYTVKQGDTLWEIAQEQLGSGFVWVDIARANNIPVDNPMLAVGDELALPAVGGPGDTVVTGETDTGTVAGTSTYTVQDGDTLWGIAQQVYGSGHDWVRIFDHPDNNIEMYTAVTTGRTYPRIEVGQELTIPVVE